MTHRLCLGLFMMSKIDLADEQECNSYCRCGLKLSLKVEKCYLNP